MRKVFRLDKKALKKIIQEALDEYDRPKSIIDFIEMRRRQLKIPKKVKLY